MMHFPDINNSPEISILVDESQKSNIKEMETLLKKTFNPKRLRFIILSDAVPDNILLSDSMICVLKDDFNKFGIMKKEKEEVLKTFSDDLFINLSDDNENMLNDYLVSIVKSLFKVGHPKVNLELHDLVVDYGVEKNNVERLKILCKYILMLSGNKNEK